MSRSSLTWQVVLAYDQVITPNCSYHHLGGLPRGASDPSMVDLPADARGGGQRKHQDNEMRKSASLENIKFTHNRKHLNHNDNISILMQLYISNSEIGFRCSKHK